MDVALVLALLLAPPQPDTPAEGARADHLPSETEVGPPPLPTAPILRKSEDVDGEVPFFERPDVREDREVADANVRVREDGTTVVEWPRAVRLKGKVCLLFICGGRGGFRPASKKHDPSSTAPMLLGIAGSFGWLPKPQGAVADFLKDTREQRSRMAEAEQRRRLRASPGETSVRLAELLHDPELDPVHRRELVFELWDDAACTEELTSDTAPLAEEKVEAARQSRERVEAFVARFMRPGSKDGYGSDELARLNAQRCSAEPFTPTRTRD